MAKVFTVAFKDEQKAQVFEQTLAMMGLKFTCKDIVVNEAKAEAEVKAETPAQAPAPAPKAEDEAEAESVVEFDRKKYLKVAKALNVLGNHGVYKFARKTVYDGMKYSRLTANIKKSLLAQLKTEAEKNGIQWYLDSLKAQELAENTKG